VSECSTQKTNGFLSAALAIVFLFAAPACAHGGAKASVKAAMPAESEMAGEPAKLKDLDDVVLGLSDFEKRASHYSKDEWNFVLGYAHFMHGKFREAEGYLEKAQGKLPLLDDYTIFFRASVANERGDFTGAIAFLDVLDTHFPGSSWAQEARVQRAIALGGLKRFDEAVRMLEGTLESASGADRDEIERLIARTYLQSGDGARAVEYVKSMAIAAGSDRDLEELVDLFHEVKQQSGIDIEKWLGSPENQLRLAESFAADSQWSDVASRIERLEARGGLDSSLRVRAKWLLAKAYRWTHRYDEAIALMEELRHSPAGRSISGLNSTLAMVYAKRNDYDKAIAIRQRMLDGLPPSSSAAANMASKIAFLYVDEDKYREAIPLWQQVAAMRSAGRNRILAQWYIGWCHYMLKDYGAAIMDFDELLGSGAKGARIEDRVLYWKGRALSGAKREDEARATYRMTVEKYPRGYYAELARRRLAGDVRGVGDFPLARGVWKGAAQWKPSSIAQAKGDPHIARAIELDELGLHAEVSRELKNADFNSSADAVEVGLWLAWKNYAHDIAYLLAHKKFSGLLKRDPGEDHLSRFVWEQALPKAYYPVVRRLDSNGDIDPMLVWSIMRNESTFKPRVISPAGAVGLMQLMPTTANLMARNLGEGKVSVSDLYRPATNIAYGITYLDKLAQLFPGNAVAVIASYNAGEQAVGRWLGNGTFNDIEEWIEEIPYSETNLYVKKVLTTYWSYQRLYGDDVRIASRNGKGHANNRQAPPAGHDVARPNVR
jgi:soluble lytic murein transglycosylase